MSEDVLEVAPESPHVDGAVLASFGSVLPGREELAVELFISASSLVEGHRDELWTSFAGKRASSG